MAKQENRRGGRTKSSAASARPQASVPGRRMLPPAEQAEAPARPTRSVAMRLASEVERLQAELAGAHAKVTELEAKADVDPLLDILNRRGFERELRRSLAYVRRYSASAALIYLDLDRFKPVNDRHGHTVGDAILKAIAAALRQAVRESDVVARLGGDEFAVLLWNVTEMQAAGKAMELEAAVAATVVAHGGLLLSVGASAGLAMLLPNESPGEAITRADLAMYARKRRRAT
jgi:diguanylate cyclase (GGDEF)-like protein